MLETGTVTKISNGSMDVLMGAERPEMCARCRACEVLGKGQGSMLHVPAPPNVAVGDVVTVALPEPSPWTGIVLVLALPLGITRLGRDRGQGCEPDPTL